MRAATLFCAFVAISFHCTAASRFPGNESSQTLNTQGHPKSKGLEVILDFPASWKIEEARRPNTIALVTSKNGLGLEVCALGINTLDQLGWPDDSARTETSKSLAARERLEMAAKDMGGRLIDGGGANLEGLPSRWFLVASNYFRDGSPIEYQSVSWQIVFDGWLINLNCGVGGESSQEAELRLKGMLPTFRLIANSMLIPDP